MRVELRRLHMKAAEMAAAEGSPWRPSPACTPQRSALSELTSDSDLLSGKYKAEIAQILNLLSLDREGRPVLVRRPRRCRAGSFGRNFPTRTARR